MWRMQTDIRTVPTDPPLSISRMVDPQPFRTQSADPFLAIARKIERKDIGVKVTLRTSPNDLRMSAVVRSSLKRLSMNLRTEAEVLTCIQVPGRGSGESGGRSNVSSTSRKRSASVVISSDSRRQPRLQNESQDPQKLKIE